jgi:hypothetical protein
MVQLNFYKLTFGGNDEKQSRQFSVERGNRTAGTGSRIADCPSRNCTRQHQPMIRNLWAVCGRITARAVNLKARAEVRSQVRPRGACTSRSGTGTGFPPSSSVFLCPPFRRLSIFTRVPSGRWTMGPLGAHFYRYAV